MSEQWAIVVLTGVVGWVAYELHQLRAELNEFVRREDCSSSMGEHCSQIKDLRAQVQKNSEKIAELKMFHRIEK